MKRMRMLLVEPDPQEANTLRHQFLDDSGSRPLERLESAADLKAGLAAGPDVLLVSRDQLERELARLREQANQEVDEVRKQCAREMAELTRQKDDFIAALSYELRDPMAPIRNSVHLLRLGGLADPAMLEALGVLDRQAQRLGKLVDDLLDVVRIQHGKLPLHQKETDLAEIVRAASVEQGAALADAGLSVEMNVPAAPVWVSADVARLAQVVSQLMRTVSQWTKPGRGAVRVTLAVDRQQSRAVVTFESDGADVPADALPKIFDLFTPSDQTPEPRRGRLGLGLALVKMLVELHGGGVQSGGRGRRGALEFWLPLIAAPAPAAANANGTDHCRVLIVEDNKDAARTLRMLLRGFGHEVEVAENGPDGLAAVHRWHPEVVLCDIGIPGLNGLEVARALRDDPETASLHLIAVSGYGQEQDRRRAHEAGFELHLTKPVDPEEIHRLLISLKLPTREPAGRNNSG